MFFCSTTQVPDQLLLVGRNGMMELASAEAGIVCSQIWPGPVILVLKIPSPPNSIF